MRYFSCLCEIIVLKIVNPLNGGDIILKNIIRLAKLFFAYLLVLLNKYRGLINIPKVTSEIYLGTATVSIN
jgi:hypothetical protein